jgi:S1-C subfamily serine protease
MPLLTPVTLAVLLNAQGEVIGINTVIRADARGLGFAIPIETAARIANQILTKGHVEHPFLGVQMVDLTSATRQQINQETRLNIKQDTGVLVVRVIEKSPSDQAGIEEGDIIEKLTVHQSKSLLRFKSTLTLVKSEQC